MSKSTVLLTALIVSALMAGVIGCTIGEETPTPEPTLTASPTPTAAPLPTPTPTPEPVTDVFNITHTLSGLSITLVMATWIGDKVDIEWRIENPTGQKFNASRLYNIFQPSSYATDQAGKEAEYFIPTPITKDLEPGKALSYHTQFLFYPESADITIRLSDVYSDGSTFVDIAVEFSFPR